jgi:hypothetical protein
MQRSSEFWSLIWLGDETPREQRLDYWRSHYAQKAARKKGVEEYRQHHFGLNHNVWPALAGVETSIPPEHRMDGLEEILVRAPVLKRRQSKAKDGAKAFKKTELYKTGKRDSSLPGRSAGHHKTGFRSAVLIRRRPSTEPREFQRFVMNVLYPAFAPNAGFFEVRCRLLQPAFKRQASRKTKRDVHSPGAYHALFMLAAADADSFHRALHSEAFAAIQKELSKFCEAIHAYTVSGTYLFAKEGRPTLPQAKKERKPRLEPVQRKLPPAPKRAFRQTGTAPFPPAQRLAISGYGPEDVVADLQGRLICGVKGGRIIRIDLERNSEEIIANTGGRPLGLEVAPDGHLLICDAHKGLLRLNMETGDMETLVQYVNNIPLRFCSNAAAASDGTIWFTESTDRYDFEHYVGDMLEHRPSGRLFKRNPDGQIEVVLDGLYFANGITLSNDEHAVIFSETNAYRLNRLWIHGTNAGKREILAENLPGFPDNISRIKNGEFWVAMVTPRNLLLDRLGAMPAFIRKLVWRIPDRLQPKGAATSWVMLFDESGNVLLDLQNPAIDYHGVTGVVEVDGRLILASTEEEALLLLDLNREAYRAQ